MTIIIGYINTPEGHAALDSGIELAAKDGKDLLIVNASRESERSDEQRLDAAEIAAVRDRLSKAGIEAQVLTLNSEMDAAEQILEAAAQADAELIVLGTRRRTPVGKFLLGSTLQRVVLDAHCPVLCVKADFPTPV